MNVRIMVRSDDLWYIFMLGPPFLLLRVCRPFDLLQLFLLRINFYDIIRRLPRLLLLL